MKPLKKKCFLVLRQEPTQILPYNFLEGATIHFYYLFDECHSSNNCTPNSVTACMIEELNWLWKHIKKVTSSQPAIVVLKKSQFFPGVSLNLQPC